MRIAQGLAELADKQMMVNVVERRLIIFGRLTPKSVFVQLQHYRLPPFLLALPPKKSSFEHGNTLQNV